MNVTPVRCAVEDQSQVAPARGAVRAVARQLGLPTVLVDRVALAATELAQNLHLHAVQGELVVAAGRAEDGTRTLDLFAIDRGPGVTRFDRCLVDGEVVRPQEGGFYGGWITADLAGPFKGIPGSMGW